MSIKFIAFTVILLLNFVPIDEAHTNENIFIFRKPDKQSKQFLELQGIQRRLNEEIEKDAGVVDRSTTDNSVRNLAVEYNHSAELMALFVTDAAQRLSGQRETRQPDDVRFFAAIDVGALSRGSLSARSIDAIEVVRNIPANTIYSQPTSGWFSTDYPDISSNLRCDWSENLRLSQALSEQAAKDREAAFDRAHRDQADGIDTSQDARQQQQDKSVQPETPKTVIRESADGLHASIRVAGIPCLVTYYCDDIDWPCSQTLLKQISNEVVLIRVGEDE